MRTQTAPKQAIDKLIADLSKDVPQPNAATPELVRILAQSITDYREITAQIASEGRTVLSAGGSLKAHPLLGAQKTAADLVTRLSGELLLSPKSRQKLEIEMASSLDSYGGE